MKVRTLVNVWIQQPKDSLPPHLADFVQLCREMVPEVSFYEAPWNQERANQVMATAVEHLYLPTLLGKMKTALEKAGASSAVMRRFEQLSNRVDPPGKPLPGGFGQIGRYRTGELYWEERTQQVEGKLYPYDLIGTLPPGTPGGVGGVFAAKFAERLPFIVAWRQGDLGAPFTSVIEWASAMKKAEALLQSTDFEEYLTWDACAERAHYGFAAFPKRLPEPCFPRVIDRLVACDGLPVTADDRKGLLQTVRWLYRTWRKGHAALAPPKVGARQKPHWDFEALVQKRALRHVPGQAHVDQAFRGLIHEIQTQKKTWRMQRWVARLRPVADEEARQIEQSFSYFDKVSAVEQAIYALIKMPMPGPDCGPVWPKLAEKYPELAKI